jgi:hypothetical protein
LRWYVLSVDLGPLLCSCWLQALAGNHATIFFLMQLSAGCVRFKNAKSVLLNVLIDTCICGIVFYFFGFGVAYGKTEGKERSTFIGTGDWGLENTGMAGIWHRWFFNFGFAVVAATIASGSVAERCSFEATCTTPRFSLGWCTLLLHTGECFHFFFFSLSSPVRQGGALGQPFTRTCVE